MDLLCGCGWVLLGIWLVGLEGRAAGGGNALGCFFFFLILFLKRAVHTSTKTAAHINEAAWVL